ncbi:MAG: alpha/beta hydrolase [Homoserinimonas sp.]
MIHLRRAVRGGIALGALVTAGALITTLAACSPDTDRVQPASAEEQVLIFSDVIVTENIAYGAEPSQQLDACQPADAEVSSVNNGPRRAVISVHGGSWREGDKATAHWRSVCEWLASEGFIAFSLNYRLAPQAPFPAAIEDVRAAVDWLRQPSQADAYGYDPALIGAFGGSAGGNLVALLGTEGSGSWDVGTRVAAVVELSAPIALTAELADGYSEKFRQVQLDYLGCPAYDRCAAARSASPVYSVDPSDPPFFIGHSRDEFIPVAQAELLVDALTASQVDTVYVEVPGELHSIALLDDELRAQIVEFLRAKL